MEFLPLICCQELLKIVRTATTAPNVEPPVQNPPRGPVAQPIPPQAHPSQGPSGSFVADTPQHFPGLPPPAIHHNHHHNYHQQQQPQVARMGHGPTGTVTVVPGRVSNFPQHSRPSFHSTSDSIHGNTNPPASQQGHMTGHVISSDSAQNRPSHFGSNSAFTYGSKCTEHGAVQ